MFLKNAMNLNRTELLKTCVNDMNHFSMLFLMKLLFGFCLDVLLPKNLDNTGE